MKGSWTCCAIVTAGVAFGSSSAAGFDLLEAYELARDNDPEFLAATHEKLATDQELRIAWARMLPNASGEASYNRTRQDIQSSDNNFFKVGETSFPITTFRIAMTQPLLRMTEVATILQSRAEVRRAAAELDVAYQDLLFRVADAYLEALGGADVVRLRERERVALERQAEIARRRLDSGLGTAPDVYEAEARLALAQADEFVAFGEARDAYQALAEITGQLRDDLDTLAREFPLALPEPANEEAWAQVAARSHPQVQARAEAVDAAQREVLKQRAGHAPTLDFTASLDHRDSDGSLFGGGSQVETADYGLEVKVPLLSGGAVLYGTRRAIELEKRERQLLAKERRTRAREARSAFHNVGSYASRVRALRKSVEVQQQAVSSREKAVRAGVDTTINVLNAERELYSALRDHAEARYDYVRNVLALEQSAGALGLEDFEQVNQWLASPESASLGPDWWNPDGE